MISMFKAIFCGFGYAFQGIFRTVKEERNFRIHLVAVLSVTWFAFLYEVTAGQALVLVILFALVLSLELLNTAVEHTVDLITKEPSLLAKKAKDAAAGAVLVSALGSVIVAVLMFCDPVHWAMVGEKMSSPIRIVCLIVFIVFALFFVKGRTSHKKD